MHKRHTRTTIRCYFRIIPRSKTLYPHPPPFKWFATGLRSWTQHATCTVTHSQDLHQCYVVNVVMVSTDKGACISPWWAMFFFYFSQCGFVFQWRYVSNMVHNICGKTIALLVAHHGAIQPCGILESVAHKAHVHGVDQQTGVGPEPSLQWCEESQLTRCKNHDAPDRERERW